MRNWRYGSPTAVIERKRMDLTGKRFGNLVCVSRVDGRSWVVRCDCGVIKTVLTGDLNAGTTKSCGNGKIHRKHLRYDVCEYSAAHARVRRDRGNAKQYECTDCDGVAEEWSYDYGDDDELVSNERGSVGMPYSLDANHYVPRCVPCHRRYDADRHPEVVAVTCSVGGCERASRQRGWCSMHYKRWVRNGDPEKRVLMASTGTCKVDGCTRPDGSRGYCGRHYQQWRKAQPTGLLPA